VTNNILKLHIRDAFALSLKKKIGDNRTKKYIYFDQLQFLMKIFEKDDTASSICDDGENEESGDEETSQAMRSDLATRPTSSRSRKRTNTSTNDATDMAILKDLEATAQPPAEIDEDAGFFASITPSKKKFNDDQKLTFRMGVLTLIQQFKKQNTRVFRPPSSNLYTSSYS
ncbi:hypothetical protein NQ314_006356, partial [Rhamnusium bicolor]